MPADHRIDNLLVVSEIVSCSSHCCLFVPVMSANFSLNRRKPAFQMNQASLRFSYFLGFFLLFATVSVVMVEGQKCKPNGKIKGKKAPKGECNQDDGADCCEPGKFYTTYKCSPPVTKKTKAILTINSFEEGGDGGGPSECDGKYHSDKTPVVALSTGWFNKKKRCHNFITIHANGKSVKAMVVDECDSTMGCDDDHSYQPPCPNYIVDASEAVWKALGVSRKDKNWGWMEVTWSDA